MTTPHKPFEVCDARTPVVAPGTFPRTVGVSREPFASWNAKFLPTTRDVGRFLHLDGPPPALRTPYTCRALVRPPSDTAPPVLRTPDLFHSAWWPLSRLENAIGPTKGGHPKLPRLQSSSAGLFYDPDDPTQFNAVSLPRGHWFSHWPRPTFTVAPPI